MDARRSESTSASIRRHRHLGLTLSLSTNVDPQLLGGFRSAVLRWAGSERRDLPWRRTRDPWSIVVSEVMLQQTQVVRVVPKWQAFLIALPTVSVCAETAQADVVRLWEGLGYHRRAVNLHRLAKAVVAEHEGVFPQSVRTLMSLPGVGPYTARAVMAFAFEGDAAVVDTNIGRIVARAIAGRPCGPREAQAIADALLPPGDAWRWNQGMLDLGAMVCTKRDPNCGKCPVEPTCVWRQSGESIDPAVGSAAVSGRQSRFIGSDRQGRGRLLAALRIGPVAFGDVAAAMGWPTDTARAERVSATLVTDGLARHDGHQLVLG